MEPKNCLRSSRIYTDARLKIGRGTEQSSRKKDKECERDERQNNSPRLDCVFGPSARLHQHGEQSFAEREKRRESVLRTEEHFIPPTKDSQLPLSKIQKPHKSRNLPGCSDHRFPHQFNSF
ncbi:hypothetical protein SRHO_G00152650 [Serrasalmus rhombeus]